jgi:putative transposase
VWGTKYRRKLLKKYVRTELIESIKRVQETYPAWYIDVINTDDDHIHILIEIPPSYSISEVVQKIKIQTSKDLRKAFKFIDEVYTKSGIWSVGYYVSTVGMDEEKIRQYIEYQGKKDLGENASHLFE